MTFRSVSKAAKALLAEREIAVAAADAIELGCYFSVKAAMLTRQGALERIPPERSLIETGHPYGDRKGPTPRLPGVWNPSELTGEKVVGR